MKSTLWDPQQIYGSTHNTLTTVVLKQGENSSYENLIAIVYMFHINSTNALVYMQIMYTHIH